MPTQMLRRRPLLAAVVAVAAVLAAAVTIPTAVDVATLRRASAAAAAEPLTTLAVVGVYAGAFTLRAWAWRRVVPDLGFAHALAGLHVSLGANHVLPLRLGEVLRVTSVVRRAGVPLDVATASTVALRAADLVALLLVAGLGGAVVGLDLLPGVVVVAGTVVVTAALAAAVGWLRRLTVRGRGVRLPDPAVAAAAFAAWALESAVVWQAARWAGHDLGVAEAVVVTAVTIAAQAVAVAPGGFGTYEAAATAALVGLGAAPGVALAIALVTHAVTTLYSLVTGAVAAVAPGPGLAGRLRLRHPAGPAAQRGGQVAPPADAPVVLFLPAHDEAATIAEVVRRAPRRVGAHPVEVVVVDDGSTDATAAAAAAAGADVVVHDCNLGLGAAVRRGLAEGVGRGAVAVAFCDADGEYDPSELPAVVAPILAGDADYVVGSRFAGRIDHMRPGRRLGNRVLTLLLRVVARTPLTDGQSGYRALSARAARQADVAHDYNYAQVLTLDLLAKGFRYAEVPIGYRFRTTGRSFVRLPSYLRRVVPAVWRVLNPTS